MVTKEQTAMIATPKDNLPDRLSPDSTIHASITDQEGNSSIVPEKPSEDGYNWRKYGQKNVKGNEYIRSYYKCSHPNCQVKKQVERAHDGRITDITYLGKHDHMKPHSDLQATVPSLLSVQVQISDQPPPAAAEETPSDVPAAATDHVEKMDVCELQIVNTTDSATPAPLTPLTPSLAKDDRGEQLTPKKRKKGIDGTDGATEKSNHESRVIVHTVSEVDIINDGYRWRKYGQKMVKGNPNPRSYYRCSTTGCPVKKHVERASHDPKVVITTYEGKHDHSMPPIRTIVPHIAGVSAGGTESNGSSKSKSEESDPEKGDSVDPKTTIKEEKNLVTVVKTGDHNSRSADEEASVAVKLEPIAKAVDEVKVPSAVLGMVPEGALTEAKPPSELDKKAENISTEANPSEELNKKEEIVLSEAKILDAIVEKSNGVQSPNADAVDC